MQFMRVFSTGLAIFAMFFGAGNIVFPLMLGREVGSQMLFGVAGFILTGVLVPLLGLISSALFDGNYKKFLNMTGRIPGMLIALVCMLLLGPFGATPRCITLAHAALKWHVPQLTLFVFSIIVAVLVFFATFKKSYVIDLFGKFLGPIKLTLLLTIVIMGLFSSTTPPTSLLSSLDCFMNGFNKGFSTLDLLAGIFFSGLVIASIKAQNKKKNALTSREIVITGLQAGVVGGVLLGLVYAGFCLLAAKYALLVADVPKEMLLSALAALVIGPNASILPNITVAVACLTTTIALTAVFADYLTHEVFLGKINYAYALLLTVTATFVMTNLGFDGIARVIEPVAIVCYPALIVLSIVNIAHALWGFRYIKTPVFVTLAITIVTHFLL